MKDAGGSLSEEQKEEMAAFYGFDRPFFPAYLVWLGVLPREADKQYVKFEKGKEQMPVTLQVLLPRAEWKPNNAYRVTQATIARDGRLSATTADELKPWRTRAEPDKERVQVFRS